MTETKIERAMKLAQLVGMTVADVELAEVADRFEALLSAMDELASLDLSAIQPITIFPDESDHAA